MMMAGAAIGTASVVTGLYISLPLQFGAYITELTASTTDPVRGSSGPLGRTLLAAQKPLARGPLADTCGSPARVRMYRELWAWTCDDADRMWSWRPKTELDAAACFPERMHRVPVLRTPGRRPAVCYIGTAECCPESITMTIPCPIFRLRPVYRLVLAPIVSFYANVAVHAEQVFSSNSAPMPAMWLGSTAQVLGISARNLFHIWMAGWMFAGLWLVLQVACLVWFL